jgi:hypothetical protein
LASLRFGVFLKEKYTEEVENMAVGPTFTTTYNAGNLIVLLTAYSSGGGSGHLYNVNLFVNSATNYLFSNVPLNDVGTPLSLPWSGFSYTPVNGDSIVVSISDVTASSPTTTNSAFTFSGSPIPCIPAGQLIRTTKGDVPVETVKSGDSIITPDGRPVVVKVHKSTALATKQNAPYLIPAHTFRPGYPKKDIQLSPHHKIQMGPDLWLSAEKASKMYPLIKQLVSKSVVRYFHFETPDFLTDDLVVEGSVVESYGVAYSHAHLKGKQPYAWSETHKAEIRMVPGHWRM